MSGAVIPIDYTQFAYLSIGWAALYVFWYQLLTRKPEWGLSDPVKAARGASRGIGVVHAVYTVAVSIYILFRAYPKWEYAIPSTPLEYTVTIVSVTYFTVDVMHFLYHEWDILLLLHHAVCLIYNGSVLYTGVGGLSVCVAIVLGEITNPLQSAWTVAKECGNYKLYAALSLPFTVSFVLARFVLTPVLVYDIVSYYVNAPAAVFPRDFMYYLRIVLPLAMMIGGWVWAYAAVMGLRKFYAKQRKLKAEANANGSGNGDSSHAD